MNDLLDTNTCIAYFRKPLGLAAQRLHAKAPTDLSMSTITIVELVHGAHLSLKAADHLVQVQRFAGHCTVLPFDVPAAEHAGRIDADLARQGLRIGPYDTLIAATALANDLTLVTHNGAEFKRVSGLRIEDWEAP